MATQSEFLALVEKGAVNTYELAQTLCSGGGADALRDTHQKIIGFVKSLQTFADLLKVSEASIEQVGLLPEGALMAEHGSHEARVFNAITDGEIAEAALKETLDGKVVDIGKSKAKQKGWVVFRKEGKALFIARADGVTSVEDTLQAELVKVRYTPGYAAQLKGSKEGKATLQDFKKRKLVAMQVIKALAVEKGPEFSLNPTKRDADLTADMLAGDAWKDKKFKKLNLDASGPLQKAGVLHPILKVKAEIREIFLLMGFEEMDTRQWVESSFWNFDALFQPQQHPARDAHDTFFMQNPAKCNTFPEDYLQRVKDTHEKGGYGSQGYRYDWSRDEASKNLLRTHTTAVSARMLYKLAQLKPFKPVKYFSIDRVFRNETPDATHLCEFHQIEGLIADYNLTLGDLMGTLSAFFQQLGLEDLTFKPAFNPYTEPSMEIFSYHPKLKKVVEIGNSGMFRPEMLEPMGLDPNINVIAWGLSVERPTMIKYGYDDIRDLFGHTVNLTMARDAPMCRL